MQSPKPRIYCDGVYDLFHLGHMRQLKQIKDRYPDSFVLVGVCSDQDTILNKGITVMNHEERCESVGHCRYVDMVIKDAPWVLTPEFLTKYDIDFVAHDDIPYAAAGCDDVYGWIKNQNKFIATKRSSVSTSDLIFRIVSKTKEYQDRLKKRGYNIS